VLVAGKENPDVSRPDFLRPVSRARRQREAEAERDPVLGQGAGEPDPGADQARAIEDVPGRREEKAARKAPTRHLGRFKPRAVDGVLEVLEAVAEMRCQ
jgi:hypothetical protein